MERRQTPNSAPGGESVKHRREAWAGRGVAWRAEGGKSCQTWYAVSRTPFRVRQTDGPLTLIRRHHFTGSQGQQLAQQLAQPSSHQAGGLCVNITLEYNCAGD